MAWKIWKVIRDVSEYSGWSSGSSLVDKIASISMHDVQGMGREEKLLSTLSSQREGNGFSTTGNLQAMEITYLKEELHAMNCVTVKLKC